MHTRTHDIHLIFLFRPSLSNAFQSMSVRQLVNCIKCLRSAFMGNWLEECILMAKLYGVDPWRISRIHRAHSSAIWLKSRPHQRFEFILLFIMVRSRCILYRKFCIDSKNCTQATPINLNQTSRTFFNVSMNTNLNQIGLQDQMAGFTQRFHYANNSLFTTKRIATTRYTHIFLIHISIIHYSTACSKEQ